MTKKHEYELYVATKEGEIFLRNISKSVNASKKITEYSFQQLLEYTKAIREEKEISNEEVLCFTFRYKTKYTECEFRTRKEK